MEYEPTIPSSRTLEEFAVTSHSPYRQPAPPPRTTARASDDPFSSPGIILCLAAVGFFFGFTVTACAAWTPTPATVAEAKGVAQTALSAADIACALEKSLVTNEPQAIADACQIAAKATTVASLLAASDAHMTKRAAMRCAPKDAGQ